MMDKAYHSNVRLDIISLVPVATRLLDIGGGTGATARYLKELGRVQEIAVMDAVIGRHTKDLEFWSEADLNDCGAVAAFLTESGPFDVILLLDVLEHLVDPWSLIDTVVPYVCPGGVLIASIPNVRHYSASFDLLLRNRWRYAEAGILDRTHLRFFVRDSAIELIDRPQLSVQSVTPSPIGSRMMRMLNIMTLGLFRSFMTLQYFIVARQDK
jgi:2-polyprenyl-3-methyl-5-hydroxy-6-metoxy-1,4-benzoquinol methylase